MKIKIFGLALITLVSILSCKTDKNTEEEIKEDLINQKGIISINYDYPSISDDSVKVYIKYQSDLDTINPTSANQRYTLLYLTQNDVSLLELEKMIEEENTTKMKKADVIGFDLRSNDSVSFYYKIKSDNNFLLKIIVDDVVFLKDYNDQEQTRMIRYLTHFQEEIQLTH